MHSVGATGSALLPTNNIANNPGASRNPAELESVPPSAISYPEGCRHGDGNCNLAAVDFDKRLSTSTSGCRLRQAHEICGLLIAKGRYEGPRLSRSSRCESMPGYELQDVTILAAADVAKSWLASLTGC